MAESTGPKAAEPGIAAGSAAVRALYAGSVDVAFASHHRPVTSPCASASATRSGSPRALRRGVLVHTTGATPEAADPDLEIDLAEADLRALLLGATRLDELTGQGRAEIRGDAGRLAELLGYLGAPDPDFAVVTP